MASVALLVMMSSVPLYKLVRQEYLPSDVDEGEFDVRVTLAEGTGLDAVNDVAQKIEAELKQVPGHPVCAHHRGERFHWRTQQLQLLHQTGPA